MAENGRERLEERQGNNRKIAGKRQRNIKEMLGKFSGTTKKLDWTPIKIYNYIKIGVQLYCYNADGGT